LRRTGKILPQLTQIIHIQRQLQTVAFLPESAARHHAIASQSQPEIAVSQPLAIAAHAPLARQRLPVETAFLQFEIQFNARLGQRAAACGKLAGNLPSRHRQPVRRVKALQPALQIKGMGRIERDFALHGDALIAARELGFAHQQALAARHHLPAQIGAQMRAMPRIADVGAHIRRKPRPLDLHLSGQGALRLARPQARQIKLGNL